MRYGNRPLVDRLFFRPFPTLTLDSPTGTKTEEKTSAHVLRLSTYWLALCICLAVQLLTAQRADTTISLPQAVVRAERTSPLVAKYPLHPSANPQHGLSELASKGLFTMPSYGPGQLTGLRAYGLPSAHTTVQWMGLTLNDPLTGQTDFSEVYPILFSDELQIQSIGQRGGLQLDLTPRLAFSKSSIKGSGHLTERFGLGCFSSADIRHHNSRGSIRFLKLTNTNRYRIPHPQGPRYQRHASKNLFGVSAAISTPIGTRSHSTVAAFSNSDHRQIPPTIDQEENSSTLSTQRKAIAFALRHDATSVATLSLQAGTMHYRIRYNDTPRQIRYQAQTFEQQLTPAVRLQLGRHIYTRIEIPWQYQRARSTGFVDAATRWIARPNAHLTIDQKKFTMHITAGGLITTRERFQWIGQWDLSRSVLRHWSIALGINRTVRLPSFNDLYWFEGGNPDLQTEHGFGSNLALDYRPGEQLHLHVNGFFRQINDFIQWIPQRGIFRATQIPSIRSWGATTTATSQIHPNLRISAVWTYTRCIFLHNRLPNDDIRGKQLLYVPLHQGSVEVETAFEDWTFQLLVTGATERYITTDNSRALPPYLLVHASAEYAFQWRKIPMRATFYVENLTDRYYELYSGWPMPGRRLHVRITAEYDFKH